jgi:hypothetical protein
MRMCAESSHGIQKANETSMQPLVQGPQNDGCPQERVLRAALAYSAQRTGRLAKRH